MLLEENKPTPKAPPPSKLSYPPLRNGRIPQNTQIIAEGEDETKINNNNNENNLYSNEEEKELYTFLEDSKLLTLYTKLKSLGLYLDHLLTSSREEFDAICEHSLELNSKPHIKVRLNLAIQKYKKDQSAPDVIAAPAIVSNVSYHNRGGQHYYPPPSGPSSPARSESDHPINNSPQPGQDIIDEDKDEEPDGDGDGDGLRPIIGDFDHINDVNNAESIEGPGHVPYEQPDTDPIIEREPVRAYHRYGNDEEDVVRFRGENDHDMKDESEDENDNENVVNYLHDLENRDNEIVIHEEVDTSWRVMVFLRGILFIIDHWSLQPNINKQITIGGGFGNFLLFTLGIQGMYNICKQPFNKKSGSLSILLAGSELFYFVSRDALSNICYQDLYETGPGNSFAQLQNFCIHAVVSLLLACCVGRIVWVYRNEIFAQIHASKWNVLCNYAVLFWVITTEMNTLKDIVYDGSDMNPSPKLEKIYNLLNVFFCTENAFLIGIVLMAPNGTDFLKNKHND